MHMPKLVSFINKQQASILLPFFHSLLKIRYLWEISCNFTGIHCWDLVAGSIIVKEAGGILLDPRTGADFDYMSRGILAASSPDLAKQVLDLNLKYHETTRDHPEKAGF